MLTPCKKSYDQPRERIKKQKHYFANKGPANQRYDFSSTHVWMWELGYKESWVPKNRSFWIVVLEKTLESPLDCKIKPVNPKVNQPWIFIGKTDAKAPVLWPPDVESWLIGKDRDAGKDWSRRRSGWQRMRWLDGITDLIDVNLSKVHEIVEDREAWHPAVLWVLKESDMT